MRKERCSSLLRPPPPFISFIVYGRMEGSGSTDPCWSEGVETGGTTFPEKKKRKKKTLWSGSRKKPTATSQSGERIRLQRHNQEVVSNCTIKGDLKKLKVPFFWRRFNLTCKLKMNRTKTPECKNKTKKKLLLKH